jgi:endonuclease/exonuclease/phosphatase family metal-dependent hydrolase
LPGYQWVGIGRDDGKERGEYNPIFVRADRWEIQEHASFWLASVCDRPGRGWDALCYRIVTWARLYDRVNGLRCVHFNTHLDHLGRNARAQSALLLLQKVFEIAGNDPVVVTGDFNCGEKSLPYRILTGDYLTDEHQGHLGCLRDALHESEAVEGPQKTYRGWMSLFGIGRIDYVFVKNGFRARRHTVLRSGGRASDHWPVVAELQFWED